jgi:hypothetical protein
LTDLLLDVDTDPDVRLVLIPWALVAVVIVLMEEVMLSSVDAEVEVESLDVAVLRVVIIDVEGTVEMVLVEAFWTTNWYSDRPFGPPQMVQGDPEHVIEQRPSVALPEPGWRILPQ